MHSDPSGPLAPALGTDIVPWGPMNPIMPAPPEQAPFPLEYLPRRIARLVADYAGWRECSTPAAFAAIIASSMMLTIGDYRIETPEPGKFVPAALYLAHVSPTGVGKTGISRPAIEPHYAADRKLAYTWRKARRERRRFESRPAKEQKEQQENGSAPAEVSEHAPALILSDTTTEAAMQRLAPDHGRGSVAMFTSEAAELLGGWAFGQRQLGQTLARLSKAWDGEPFTVARRKDDFDIRIENPQLVIYWQGQPGNLGTLLASADAGNGFAPRCLVCADDRPMLIAEDSPAEPPSVRQYLAAIAAGRERQDAGREFSNETEGQLPLLSLSPGDRQRLRMRRRMALQEMQDDANGTDALPHYFGFMSRIAEHATRIAGVLCAAEEYIAHPAMPPEPSAIPSDCITAGLNLAEWYANELLRITEHAGATELTAAAERLSVVISEVAIGMRLPKEPFLRKGEMVNPDRIGFRCGNASLKKDVALRGRAVSLLVDAGHIRPVPEQPRWYEVNPALLI